MTRSDILSAAAACVTQDRNNTYGPPEDSFAVIGQYWSTYLGVPVGAAQVGTLLALMKIARLQSNPGHADSYVDLAGYAACAGGIATEINKPSAMEKLRKVALPTLATNSDEWHARNAACRTHQTAPDPERGGWRDTVSGIESVCADEEPLNTPA